MVACLQYGGLFSDLRAVTLRNYMFRRSPEQFWSFEPDFKGYFGEVCNIFVWSVWRKESVADTANFQNTDQHFLAQE